MTTTGTERGGDTRVDKLRDMVADFIGAVTTQGEKALDSLGLGSGMKCCAPTVDVVETAETVLVYVNLPGVDPAGVEVLLTGNMLTVKGKHAVLPKHPEDIKHRGERPCGDFLRSISLPVAVNPERVAAEAKNGVLTVTLTKEERLKPRHIQVQVKEPPTM